MQIEDFRLEGNNFNQRKVIHPMNGICRTIFGGGHTGNEPKVLIVRKVLNDKSRTPGRTEPEK